MTEILSNLDRSPRAMALRISDARDQEQRWRGKAELARGYVGDYAAHIESYERTADSWAKRARELEAELAAKQQAAE